ncbi:carbonic anhydrase [Spiribacter sp. SSL99]|uniref:beta-class carbonic anhydrase n=1 Tax=Spiribacter sp. SSL99 TaxID=1866884 RepID=UPI00132F866A|nr:carbonic anhydrase [Spiribacter sp. SSL99]KAF0285769.1 carbonic anhydrase [Spiribacter sp. SSL99]
MSRADEFIDANRQYASQFTQGDLPMPPARQVAVVACMDARLDVYRLLGLGLGEAHVIRNAGGVVTDDVVRSLLISQRLLGTTEIVLIHHTDCGMLTFKDDAVKADIEKETGHRPAFALDAFDDPYADVRQSIRRLKAVPYLPNGQAISGFVYNVAHGTLEPVSEA